MKLVRKDDHAIAILGTLERLPGMASISAVSLGEDGKIGIVHNGQIDIWRDNQETELDLQGLRIFVDANLETLGEDEIELIEGDPASSATGFDVHNEDGEGTRADLDHDGVASGSERVSLRALMRSADDLTIDGLDIDTWVFRDCIHIHLENGRALHIGDQDVDIDTAGTAMCTDMDGGQHEIAALMCRPFTPADIKESP